MSDARRDDDYAAIAWPGFVDVLSAVLLMFVFFVLVTAVALYLHIIIYKSTVDATVTEVTAAGLRNQIRSLQVSNANIQNQAQTLEKENNQLRKEVARYAQFIDSMGGIDKNTCDSESVAALKIEASMAQGKDQQIIVDEETKTVIVQFSKSAISLQKDKAEELEKTIKDYLTRYPDTRVTLLAGKQPNSVTETAARKLAVARLLNVRNALIDAEVQTQRIVANIEEPQEVEGGYNWVKIIFSGER